MALMKYREGNEIKWVGVRPGHRGEQIVKSGAVSANTAILYTVDDGYILHLTSWTLGVYLDTVGQTGEFRINNTTPALWLRIAIIKSKLTGGGWLAGNFWPPLEVPEKYIVEIYSTGANTRTWAMFHGWIEKA